MTLPDDIVARIEGKSSLGRLGLIVHATAGFCDPGWSGTLTLELNNLTRVPIKLWAGLPIAQLSFMTLDAPARAAVRARRSWAATTRDSVAATESRYGGAAGVAAWRMIGVLQRAADRRPMTAEANETTARGQRCGGRRTR